MDKGKPKEGRQSQIRNNNGVSSHSKEHALKATREFEATLCGLRGHIFRFKKSPSGEYVNVVSEGQIAEKFEITTEQIKGRTLGDIFTDPVQFTFVKSFYDRAFSGEYVEFDSEVGTSCFRTTLYPFEKDEHGSVLEIIGYSEDVTEKKRAQEAVSLFRSAVESSTDGIGVSTPQGKHWYQNSSFSKMFGEAIGDDPPATVFVDQALGREVFGTIMRGDQWSGEVEMYSKNGDILNIKLRAYAIKDEAGRILGLVGVHTDITGELRFKEQLRQVEKMEAVGQLAGGIAHDFNNQLAGIMGYADILKEEVQNNATALEYADAIMKSTQRAADLTSQLLAFSRKGNYLTVPVDLHKAIIDVITLLKHSIDKRISIHQELNAISANTMGDPTQLQNAILNLGLNARDAMKMGGILKFTTENIFIDEVYANTCKFVIDPGQYVMLSVSDTGEGMDEETQKRIFEPFFTTKEQGKGTGMGLAAVYGTVKSHKGAIQVQSNPEEGSVFSIYLPLVREKRLDSETKTIPIESSLQDAHILFVDDEETVCEAISQILTLSGFKLTTKKNGKEALEFYKLNWPNIDLVILDMVMPEMGGKETFIAMREINPDVLAFLSSGYSINGEAQSILDEGVKGFLQKPYRKNDLLAKIAEVLGEDF